jgi:hypothetical protein
MSPIVIFLNSADDMSTSFKEKKTKTGIKIIRKKVLFLNAMARSFSVSVMMFLSMAGSL